MHNFQSKKFQNQIYDASIAGLLLLDKPRGITSFGAINIVKNTINIKKCCHCGTLDPAASGLLLVLINRDVKRQSEFIKQDKTYKASVLLGTSTDTYDLDGKIIAQKDVQNIKTDDIESALQKFRGEIEQIPPMFSALKIGGEKLCNLARKGIIIDRKPRKVVVKKLELVLFKDGVLDLLIECSSGTYIRSIANDLGEILGCGATICALRRTQIGKFRVEESLCEMDFRNSAKIKTKIINIGDSANAAKDFADSIAGN